MIGPSIPPSPSNVTAVHPLLVRTENQSLGGTLGRVHRAPGRQRGTYRYNPSTQTLHVQYTSANSHHPNPPTILQRYLKLGSV